MRGALSLRGVPLRGVLPVAGARLAALCYVPPSVGTDGRVDTRLRLWFQRFLSIKLWCMFHLVWAWHAPGGGWLHVVAAAATLGMNVPRTARCGALAWLGLVLALVARSWPYTLNHILLERFPPLYSIRVFLDICTTIKMPPGQICAAVESSAIDHLDKPGPCRTFRCVEGVLPAMKLQENLLDQVLCLPLIAENAATDGKGKLLITMQ